MAFCHYDEQGISGQFPQHGAIFMSDNLTRQECFERKLFGLPSRFLKFVQKVKAGMPLFLFDYQERKLYGVFEATTDGSMNIVPHAFQASRMSFPAQVRFRIFWRCCPVPEHAFCDIIKENYYAHNKFHFGLSSNQVKELLCLFENRRIEIAKASPPIHLISEPATAESQCECDISEQPSMSTPEKPENAGVFDGRDLASEDYIPLPSSDGEDESPSLKSDDEHAEGRSDVCEESITVTSRILCETQEKGGEYQVKKLYSDCEKARTSAFRRLSKTTRMKKEATNARRATFEEDKSLITRKSVFSRLSFLAESNERQHLKKRRLVANSAKRVFDNKAPDRCSRVQVEAMINVLSCGVAGEKEAKCLSPVAEVEAPVCLTTQQHNL